MNENFDPIYWACKNINSHGSEIPEQTATPAASAPASSTASSAQTTSAPAQPTTSTPQYNSPATSDEIRDLVRAITMRGANITEGYDEWLRTGFALCDGMGEAGRPLFHQLSQMSSKYRYEDCDKQYTACMRSHGKGVTIASLFHMAKDAGIDLKEFAKEHSGGGVTDFGKGGESDKSDKSDKLPNCQNISKNQEIRKKDENRPRMSLVTLSLMSLSPESQSKTFCDKIAIEDWPGICRAILNSQSDAAGKDKMMLASLNIISGLLPDTLFGIYDRHRVYAALFNILYGGFATRKGDIEACRHLAGPVKNEMRRAYEAQKMDYEQEIIAWESTPKSNRGAQPKEPVFRTPFVAANSSASAVYRLLDANGGWGVMFETEADSLTNMLSKAEYGDYTDLLRKIHHHETCTMVRVADKLNIELENPRLSVLLTCTGSQLPLLLPSSNIANGLASRFLFYELPNSKTKFRNVFENVNSTIEDTYKDLGEKVLVLYHALEGRKDHPIQFILTQDQQEEFVSTFDSVLKEQFGMLGDGIQGFIFRMALECFRYAMVLTALRRLSDRYGKYEDLFDENEQGIICDKRDFHIAMTIVECLVNHTGRVYSVIGSENKDPFAISQFQPTPTEKKFFNALPDTEFTTAEAFKIGEGFNITQRTVMRYLGTLCTKLQVLDHIKRSTYRKIIPSESGE